MSRAKTSVFSFFSGLGFLDLGFENAGFNIDLVNELDPAYLYAYKYARNDEKGLNAIYNAESIESLFANNYLEKIKKYVAQKSCEAHVGFIGGPPCPDFSIAGKNRGSKGKNGRLTKSYFDLIIEATPDFFLFENVKGLYTTSIHRAFYEKQKKRLEKAGYVLFESLENAIEYGAPQFRERLILIGFSKIKYGNDILFSFDYGKTYDWNKVKQKKWPGSDPFELDSVRGCPRDIYKKLTVEHWFQKNSVDNHPNSVNCFRARALYKFSSIAEGDTSGKSFKRLHRWKYSPTAAYGNNEVHLHPYKERRISVAEALAIQSLPKSLIVAPSLPLSAMFKMVGNGVPYRLALGIANNLMDTLLLYEEGAFAR